VEISLLVQSVFTDMLPVPFRQAYVTQGEVNTTP